MAEIFCCIYPPSLGDSFSPPAAQAGRSAPDDTKRSARFSIVRSVIGMGNGVSAERGCIRVHLHRACSDEHQPREPDECVDHPGDGGGFLELFTDDLGDEIELEEPDEPSVERSDDDQEQGNPFGPEPSHTSLQFCRCANDWPRQGIARSAWLVPRLSIMSGFEHFPEVASSRCRWHAPCSSAEQLEQRASPRAGLEFTT